MPLLDLLPMTSGHLSSVPAALRRLSAVAALLGLLAMHGFAPHGASHATPRPDTSSAMGPAMGPAMSMSSPPTTAATADGRTGTSAAPSGDRHLAVGSSSHPLAGMCLAVLLIGLLVALRLDSAVAIARRAWSGSRAGERPARARRHRDPPWLFALSIQRC